MENQIILKLEDIKKEYEFLNKEILEANKNNNFNKIKELSQKQKKYKITYDLYINFLNISNDIKDLEFLLKEESKDQKLIEQLKKNISDNKKEIINLEKKLLDSLIEKDPLDSHNAFFEIKGAAGGLEANFFASDLLNMYFKYSQKIGFKFKLLDELKSEKNGIAYVNFKIVGDGAFGKFKFESGVHRVQRIPSTESSGRVHTSTATVVVYPELDESDLEINRGDLRIDTYRSSGAGGQHINKTDSAVRITHIPTGISVSSQSGRSQHDNKDKAMQFLRNRLYDQKILKERESLNKVKKDAVGTGDRSEKIRTYNFPQNRITDHRVNLTLKKLDIVINGDMEEFLTLLQSSFKNKED